MTERKIGTIIKNAAIFYCVVFTAATIISSIFQLCMGQTTDTNSHILNRAAICLIGVFAYTLAVNVKIKNRIVSIIIAYAITMPVVFAYVFVTGLFEELHSNAYRDIFLNFTAVFIVITVVLFIIDYIKAKKSNAIEKKEAGT